MDWWNRITELEVVLRPLVVTFWLVLARVTGLVVTAPLFAPVNVAWRIRAVFALAVATVIAPMQAAAAGWATMSRAMQWTGADGGTQDLLLTAAGPEVVVDMGGEFIIGAALGLAVTTLFAGVRLIGHLAAQLSGISLAGVFDPSTRSSAPATSQFVHMASLAVFFSVGGHRRLVGSLLDSFTTVPPGTLVSIAPLADSLVIVLNQSYLFGLNLAIPLLVVLMTSAILLGMIGRSIPQLNVLSMGFSMNTLVMLGGLSLALSAMGWMLEDQIQTVLDVMLDGVAETRIVSPAWNR